MLAASVPDPEAKPEYEVSGHSGTRDAMTTATTWCGAWAEAWYRKRSLLGTTIYKWHHKVVYCRDGSRVLRWENRYDFIRDAQDMVKIRELEVDQENGIGGTSAWSERQRHLEYCLIKYGCYSSRHPHSTITVRGDATYSVSGSAG